jgi:hypothetical protein
VDVQVGSIASIYTDVASWNVGDNSDPQPAFGLATFAGQSVSMNVDQSYSIKLGQAGTNQAAFGYLTSGQIANGFMIDITANSNQLSTNILTSVNFYLEYVSCMLVDLIVDLIVNLIELN